MAGHIAGTTWRDAPRAPGKARVMRGEIAALASREGLEAEWLQLEADADGSPFTTWHWVDAWLRNLPAEVVPLVFRAYDAAGLGAIGLLVLAAEQGARRLFGRYSLRLQETADAELDEITVEYSGLLVRRGAEARAYAALFESLHAFQPRWRRLRIVATTHGAAIAAALPTSMQAVSMQARRSHYVDLAAVRASGGDYVATLGASSRGGLRQTARAYAALGPVRCDVATDAGTALQWLGELEALHTGYWRSRGRQGSFASAFFARFHRDLVATGTTTGYTRITRVSAGDTVVGYLYNLCWRNRIYFYNSGLNYGLLDKHDRPGIFALRAAIEQAVGEGRDEFDLLAGTQAYKTRLATSSRLLHWIDVRRNGPMASCERLLATLARRHRGAIPLAQALAVPD
ncbi:GNAT family N-acetyltransferase [Luteimonas sp. MC1782]|uniref:GNAT family N-acetyltransferase n=1 Tax=Luteimonas sp. MC1782 TaxID=2760305 RepID=UPI0015FFD39B|nr:GNAT family N-acetyltransferase [Luteimonas sp. MC1782]MBB1472349.1 GNAT family N-acetyltransferase [Luteimonas sp. MC1782]